MGTAALVLSIVGGVLGMLSGFMLGGYAGMQAPLNFEMLEHAFASMGISAIGIAGGALARGRWPLSWIGALVVGGVGVAIFYLIGLFGLAPAILFWIASGLAFSSGSRA